MMTVEELQVLISANGSQFKGELLGIKKELQSLNNTTNGVGRSIGGNLFGTLLKTNILSNVITGTVSRLAGGFQGLVTEVISSGSALSRLRIANSAVTANMGMTSDQVQLLRRDLADANTYGINAEEIISTLALSGLVKLSESLSYVDGRSGETKTGVTALTLAIKDLAAARGIDSDLGIEKVSKFIQRGEATFADGIIELSNLTDEYQAYANTLHKSVGDLTAQEKAMVRMNLVMREGAKSFGAYAATYNTSGKIISSVGMLVKSIIADFGAGLEPIFRVASIAVLEFFRGIQESMFRSANAIQNFAIKAAGWLLAIVRLIGRLGQNLPFVGGAFKRLANLTLQPIKANGKLADSIGGVGNSASDANKKAKELEDTLAGFDEMTVLNQSGGTGTVGSGGGATPDIGVGGGGGGLNDVTDVTSQINEEMTKAEEKIKSIIAPITDFINKLKEVKIFGVPVWDVLMEIGKYTGLAILAFNILSPIVGTVSGFFGGFGGILTTVGGVLSGIAAPILIVVGVIALLVAGIVSAWNQSEQFRNSVTETFNQIGAVIQQLVGVFMEKLPAFQAALQPLIDSVGNLLRGAFDLLGKIVIWVWNNVLKPLIDFVLANIVPAFSMVLDVLIFVIGIFVKVATTILDIVMPVLNTLWTIFTTVFNAIRDIISFVWNNIIYPIFKAIYDVITGLVVPVIQNLFLIFSTVFNKIREVVEMVWGKILEAIRPVINWIKDNIMPVINEVKDKFEKAFNSVRDTVSNIWDGIKNIFKGGINGIIDFLNGMIDKVNGLINSVNKAGKSIPGWKEITFRVGKIPKLAGGGIITSPTVAMMGEGNYSEAVLPLDRNTQWADRVAELITKAQTVSPQGATVVVKLGEETIFQKFLDYTNDVALTTNKPILNI